MVQFPVPGEGRGGPRPPSPTRGQRRAALPSPGAAGNAGAHRLLAQGHPACSRPPTACSARPWALDAGPHCTQALCPPQQLMPAQSWHPPTGDRAGGGEAGRGPPPAVLLRCGARGLRTPGQPGWAGTWMCRTGRLSEPGPQPGGLALQRLCCPGLPPAGPAGARPEDSTELRPCTAPHRRAPPKTNLPRHSTAPARGNRPGSAVPLPGARGENGAEAGA